MNNWSFYSDKNYYLKILVALGLCFKGLFSFGQTEFNAQAFLLDDQTLQIQSAHTSEDLNWFLQEQELKTGLHLNAYVVPFQARFPFNQQAHSYTLPLNAAPFELGIYLNQVGPGDWLISHYAERTDTLILGSHVHTFYWESEGAAQALEYIDQPPYNQETPALSGLTLRPQKSISFGDAGPCQVNANCQPENNQANSAKATVRILWRNGSLQGWCTGSLINNSAYNYRPYLLTAEHCALANGLASSGDFNQWVFYFNYQSATCVTPGNDNGLNNDFVTGAKVVARSNDNGGDEGSDFLLLEANTPIPDQFNAYYAGWNRSTLPSASGVCYHHPAGDLKKVSTYNRTPALGSFGQITEDTHWVTNWIATANGHGTTEGGSSGSALLDENGLILGILTGGASSCSATNLNDYYGTLAYGWQSNGTNPQNQLKPWLDPENSGLLKLNGAFKGAAKPNLGTGQLNIAPNPVVNKVVEIEVLGNFSEPLNFQLFSIGGQLVMEAQVVPLPGELPTFKVPANLLGIFIARLSQGSKSHTQKLWIQ